MPYFSFNSSKRDKIARTLAVEASKRARELIGGSLPLIETRETKPLTIAIEEINRGLITYTRDPQTEIEDSGEEE